MSLESESGVWDWYLRGIGGAINRLDELHAAGVRLEPAQIASLEYIRQRLNAISSRVNNQPVVPVTAKPTWPTFTAREKGYHG